MGSESFAAASRLRLDLISQLGPRTSSALLRSLTRDGRLHPGLAEPIDGPVVNSERAERTSDEDFERMMAIGAGRWPSETGRSPFL